MRRTTRCAASGEMDNRIKDHQLGLFADRTSYSDWVNQFRLLPASLAYKLMQSIREIELAGLELVGTLCRTIQAKPLKIGALIISSIRRLRCVIPNSCPYRELVFVAAGGRAPSR